MLEYSIKKAVACHRYDLMVNGIAIASEHTRKLTQAIADSLVTKGLLTHSHNKG